MSAVGRRFVCRALAPSSPFRRANVVPCSRWTCAVSSIRLLFTGQSRTKNKTAKHDPESAQRFSKNVFKKLGPFWLRDNCQCEKCHHPQTRQREVDTFAIPPDISIKKVIYAAEGLKLNFSDGHTGFYTYPWLKANGTKVPSSVLRADHSAKPRPYHPFTGTGPYPTVLYDDVMQDDKGLLQWLDKIYIYGFCFVIGVPVTTRDTEKLLERIAFIRPTHYGGFWDFTSDMSFGDSAYTSQGLGAHTDTTYFTDPARLQLFHLLSHTDGKGGASLLVDGFRAAETLQRETKAHYAHLMRLSQPAHASGNENVCIQPIHEFPVLEVHPQLDQLYRIRWNNYDRAPKTNWGIKDVKQWYTAARHWNEIISREKFQIWTQLEPGTALIFDNWRMLHGRSEFTGKRRMCGGYINNDDFLSQYRLLKFGREHVLNSLGNWHGQRLKEANPNFLI